MKFTPIIHLPDFAKQLLGAGAGALVALVLYGAYSLAAPVVSAFLPADERSPVKTEVTAEEREARLDQVGSLARGMIEEALAARGIHVAED